MKPRSIVVACALWVVAAVALAFHAAPARAAGPRDQGWWSVTSVAVPGAPVAIPPAPGPPDVPARGLVVQGGGNAPIAYSALLYELDKGTTASTLTLAVAPNSVTTPGATLQVCGLLQPINHPEQGGPLTDGPPYNCGRKATATPTANTYKFNVSGLVTDNLVAVAILPTGPLDRVVLNAPGDDSLATQGGSADNASPVNDTSDASTFSASDSVPAVGSDVAGSSAPVGDGFSGVDATAPAVVGDSPIAAPAPAVTPSGPASNVPFVPASTAAPEKATPLAVVLLIAGVIGGALLWAFAGSQRGKPAFP